MSYGKEKKKKRLEIVGIIAGITSLVIYVGVLSYMENVNNNRLRSSSYSSTNYHSSSESSNSSYNLGSSSYYDNSSSSESHSSVSSVTTQKVKCSNCGGTGIVKYYYGSSAVEAYLSGHNDYEWGTCGSCNGTGYVSIKTSGSPTNSSGSANVVCPSCGKYVNSLQTKTDATGTSQSWCSECWNKYDSILGR